MLWSRSNRAEDEGHRWALALQASPPQAAALLKPLRRRGHRPSTVQQREVLEALESLGPGERVLPALCLEWGILEGHRKRVWALAFSPNGETLMSGSEDGTVGLWEVPKGRLQALLPGHEEMVTSPLFSPRGDLLATASYAEGEVWLWEVATGRRKATLSAAALLLCFSPEGKTLATGSGWGKEVILWDVERGERQGVLEGHEGPVRAMAFSPDGRWLATGSLDGTIGLWSRRGQQEARWRGHRGGVLTLAFAPQGNLLASGGLDGRVGLWDLEGKGPRWLEAHQAKVVALAFSPPGNLLVSESEDGLLCLWEVRRARRLCSWRNLEQRGASLAFLPDGETLMTTSDYTEARWWEVQGGGLIATGPEWVQALSLDGKHLATAERGGRIRLWRLMGQIPLAQWSEEEMEATQGWEGRQVHPRSPEAWNFVGALLRLRRERPGHG